MNRLENKDCYVTRSHDERLWLINLLEENGIPIAPNTSSNRHIRSSSREYPTIKWRGHNIGAYSESDVDQLRSILYEHNPMSLNEFLYKAGVLYDMKPFKVLKKVEL